MSEATIALFGLLGAVVGSIPALLGVVIPWLRDRDRISKEKRHIDRAKAEVELISVWIDTIGKVAPDTEQERAQAHARLQQLFYATAQAPATPTPAPAQPRKGSGPFYAYLGFYCFMMFGASIDAEGSPSWQQLVAEMQGDGAFPMLVLLVPLVYLFWRWRFKKQV